MHSNFAIHFGVVPEPGDTPVATVFDGVTGVVDVPIEPGIYASGTWQEWGVDPDSPEQVEHLTLHVVVDFDDRITNENMFALREKIVGLTNEGRVLDFATVTSGREWSEEYGVVTFGGTPDSTYIHKGLLGYLIAGA